MKATKYFRLKALWEKTAQPAPVAPVEVKVEKPVAPPVVVEEPKVSSPKASSKKITNA